VSDLLRITNLTVRYGGTAALSNLDLTVRAGELFVLLGQSGSGKSTLLRAIGGFVRPAAGRIELDGVDLAPLPPHKRPVNTMFQSYALFPHMSVARNIGFGPAQRGVPRREIDALVEQMLALVQLDGLGDRKPHQLSGGQQQRVALARGLAANPLLLLLDEPLSALDRGLRAETRAELMRVNRRTGTGFILVTHDQEEALGMADRIGVMHLGRMAQVGTPRELYEAPASRFVATFIGSANVLDGRATGAGFEAPGIGILRVGAPAPPDTTVRAIAIRPERIRIGDDQAGENRVPATVTAIDYAGDSVTVSARLPNGAVLRARQALTEGVGAHPSGDRRSSPAAIPVPGQAVTLSWRAAACIPLPD